jgi:hypothetical protein
MLISSLGMQDHFKSMGRGVIDTRPTLLCVVLFYFFPLLFLNLNLLNYNGANQNNNLKNVLLIAFLFLLVNAIGNSVFYRFDLTKDKDILYLLLH